MSYKVIHQKFGENVGNIILSFTGHPNTEKWCRKAMSDIIWNFSLSETAMERFDTPYELLKFIRLRELNDCTHNTVMHKDSVCYSISRGRPDIEKDVLINYIVSEIFGMFMRPEPTIY